jgi:hypothetical protein
MHLHEDSALPICRARCFLGDNPLPPAQVHIRVETGNLRAQGMLFVRIVSLYYPPTRGSLSHAVLRWWIDQTSARTEGCSRAAAGLKIPLAWRRHKTIIGGYDFSFIGEAGLFLGLSLTLRYRFQLSFPPRCSNFLQHFRCFYLFCIAGPQYNSTTALLKASTQRQVDIYYLARVDSPGYLGN